MYLFIYKNGLLFFWIVLLIMLFENFMLISVVNMWFEEVIIGDDDFGEDWKLLILKYKLLFVFYLVELLFWIWIKMKIY